MREFRIYVGREVSVMTPSGSFQGKLLKATRKSLTIDATAYFDDRGERQSTPAGVIVVSSGAVEFVQVR